mmetsp:Transcript_20679/g.30586  ORF Transcript_20679/g.30586 Transcript_20679/m.30586 type:complete len:198 (+) Transcript_20679:65-658(+)
MLGGPVLFFNRHDTSTPKVRAAGKMSVQEPSVDSIFKRAQAGSAGKVSVEECAYLRTKIDGEKGLPAYCTQLLHAANKRGILPRRNSAVGKTWKVGEHGVNRLRITDPVGGGALDLVNPAECESTDEIYMRSKTPEQREKIRRLQVRTASRGAKPRVDFNEWSGKKENQTAVHREVSRELVRRASRKESSRSPTMVA